MPSSGKPADSGRVADAIAALNNSAARKLDFSKPQTLTAGQQTTALTTLGATSVGRQLATAADAAAARSAIGAVTLGTSSATAKRGDYTPSTTEVRAAGGVTSVTVNGTSYAPTAGVVDLGTLGGGSGGTPVATTDPGTVTTPTVVAPTDGSDTYLILP